VEEHCTDSAQQNGDCSLLLITRNRKYFPSVEAVADGPIYCITVEQEVGFVDSKSAVTDAFSLPVWPETAVGRAGQITGSHVI